MRRFSFLGSRLDQSPRARPCTPSSRPRVSRRALAGHCIPALLAGVLASACAVEIAGTGPLNVAIVDGGAAFVPGGGSGHDGGGGLVDAGQSSDGASVVPIDATLPQTRGCTMEGRFALRVDFDVAWVGTEFLNVIPVVEKGEGELSFVVLVELTKGPDGLDARYRNCSATVPEFVSSVGEHYQARFKDLVWDSPKMPIFDGQLQLDCNEPGCHFTGDPLVALIGAALPQPMGPWPTSPAGASWPDHDGDGEPGIAAYMAGPSEGDFSYPPVDLFFSRRVRELMLGLRVVVGIDGTMESCDELRGVTPASSIHTRAANCLTSTWPYRCSSSELSFLNDNLPVWTVRQGRFQAKRLDSAAECQEARQAFPRNLP